jgi:hypothetical protein
MGRNDEKGSMFMRPIRKPSERLASTIKPASQPSPIWTFLNSAFGMWLVTVGIVGTAWKMHDEDAKKEDEAAKIRAELRAKDTELCSSVARLDLEVGYRLTQVQSVLYDGSLRKKEADRMAAGNDAMDMLRRSPASHPDMRYLSLYPQYGAYGVPALVAELRHLEETPIQDSCPVRSIWLGHKGLPSKSIDPEATRARTEALQGVLSHLTSLSSFFEVRHIKLDQPTRIAGAIVEEIALPRWKAESGWYYLEEGSNRDPFP